MMRMVTLSTAQRGDIVLDLCSRYGTDLGHAPQSMTLSSAGTVTLELPPTDVDTLMRVVMPDGSLRYIGVYEGEGVQVCDLDATACPPEKINNYTEADPREAAANLDKSWCQDTRGEVIVNEEDQRLNCRYGSWSEGRGDEAVCQIDTAMQERYNHE